jgi:non-ribosomal peptide synthetase component F
VLLTADRTVETIVGMLGILKAGGVYVPIDPGSPPSRLAFLIEDSKATVTLSQAPLREGVPAPHRIIRLDADWEPIAEESWHISYTHPARRVSRKG